MSQNFTSGFHTHYQYPVVMGPYKLCGDIGRHVWSSNEALLLLPIRVVSGKGGLIPPISSQWYCGVP